MVKSASANVFPKRRRRQNPCAMSTASHKMAVKCLYEEQAKQDEQACSHPAPAMEKKIKTLLADWREKAKREEADIAPKLMDPTASDPESKEFYSLALEGIDAGGQHLCWPDIRSRPVVAMQGRFGKPYRIF
jgi:hypothetical protein